MAKTHKVQVTLDEDQYQRLAEVASREEKTLAAVVRESVVRYCVEPEEQRRKLEALERLEAVDAPAPEDYSEWEREYSTVKSGLPSAGGPQDDGDAS